MSSEALRTQLRPIVQNDFHVPEDIDPFELADEMMCYIGCPDGELRDELIYVTLAHWIIQGIFTAEQLRVLLGRGLDDEHLFYRVGEQNSDSVFTRAFSVLIIPPVLSRHRKEPFLRAEEIKHVHQELSRYLRAEQDLRGYVEGKGWAHAVAHSADGLGSLAQCRELGRDELLELLELTRDVVGTMQAVYSCGEDERLAGAANHALTRKELGDEDVAAWLESFRDTVLAVGAHPLPEGYRGLINLKHFLRVLYFRLRQQREQRRKAATAQIEQLLEAFSGL